MDVKQCGRINLRAVCQTQSVRIKTSPSLQEISTIPKCSNQCEFSISVIESKTNRLSESVGKLIFQSLYFSVSKVSNTTETQHKLHSLWIMDQQELDLKEFFWNWLLQDKQKSRRRDTFCMERSKSLQDTKLWMELWLLWSLWVMPKMVSFGENDINSLSFLLGWFSLSIRYDSALQNWIGNSRLVMERKVTRIGSL